MPTLVERLQHGWNAFINNKDPTGSTIYYGGYSYRPDRVRLTRGHERSIVNSIYNRIAEDVAQTDIKHVKTDETGFYVEDVKSGLNNVLTVEANIDQTGRNFIQDMVMSMMDEGVVAAVPVDTNFSPKTGNTYDILSMRVGKIKQWYPQHVRVEIYNDKLGRKQEVTLPKAMVAIMENPFYSIMNEPNSILQRLIRKLNLLDSIDEQASAGKLDLIIQLPYTIRSEARRKQAENRRKDIEGQLMGSKYGIAYTDGTEKITQLNRPVENNLLKTIEYLTETLMSQLGITNEILNGTATDETMANYQARIIEPYLSVITNEFRRKFLTKTARSKGQSVMFFKDPFRLVSATKMGDIADKFVTSEILSPNEVRRAIGYRPSPDSASDELRNRHLNQPPIDMSDAADTISRGQEAVARYLQEENQNEQET